MSTLITFILGLIAQVIVNVGIFFGLSYLGLFEATWINLGIYMAAVIVINYTSSMLVKYVALKKYGYTLK